MTKMAIVTLMTKIESVDRNVSWDPHVLSCRPPCKGQGEEEGGRAGHDDEEDDDEEENYDNDKSGIGDNRSGSSIGEICPPAILTPLEAFTPNQTNVIGCRVFVFVFV